GFILYGLCEVFLRFLLPRFYFDLNENFQQLVGFILMQMLFVNLTWGLINLLPVLPLDGGRICQEICQGISPFRGILYAAWVGVFVGGAAAAWFFVRQETYPGILFLMLAFSNFNIVQQWQQQFRR